MRRAVFLDRDGVLNAAVVRDGKPYPPPSVADVEMEPDAPRRLAELGRRGFLRIVVTNQPDVARGSQTRSEVDAINGYLQARMEIDDVYVCDHDGEDGCDCRKPKPGMLIRARNEHGIDLGASYMIGDRRRDIEAGQAAGCRMSIWIDRGYREPEPAGEFVRVESLSGAVAWILGFEKEGKP